MFGILCFTIIIFVMSWMGLDLLFHLMKAGMHIWMVVTFFGQIVVSVGPLPYNMAGCEQHRLHYVEEFDEGFRQYPVLEVQGRPLRRSDVVVKCVEAISKPELSPDFK